MMQENESLAAEGPSGFSSEVGDERFRLIEENVQDYAIFLIDTSGKIATWNVGASRILGYNDDEIIGQPMGAVFTPEDRDRNAPGREIEKATRIGRAEDERWHLRKDGSRFWGNGILTSLRNREGRLCGFVKILRDFTDRKVAEQRAREHQAEIEALNHRLKRSVSETHHRVKNNLQVITALLDMKIMEGGETVPMAELRRLRLHIRALASIHELLTQSVKSDNESTEISTASMMEQLQPMLLTSIGGRPVVFDIADLKLPTRYASSLAILVNELVTNAVKHGEGTITVQLVAGNGEACLSVSDEGPGFPPDFAPRTHSHTGLDLIESLSRWDLKGSIAYNNRPTDAGRGAAVEIVFPLPCDEDWRV